MKTDQVERILHRIKQENWGIADAIVAELKPTNLATMTREGMDLACDVIEFLTKEDREDVRQGTGPAGHGRLTGLAAGGPKDGD